VRRRLLTDGSGDPPWEQWRNLRTEPVMNRPDDSSRPGIVCAKWSLTLLSLFLAALAVRLVFLYIAPNNSTDAWSRYLAARLWLQHPGRLPPATAFDAWLPMHFWLLGIVLWITKSEIGARIFSVLLGSLSVIFVAGIAARGFDRRVALWSGVLLTFFGFHIEYSVTTSSEALTIFLLVLGVFAWLRYAEQRTWPWLVLSSVAFIAASLCRFEPWLCPPVLGFMLLDFSDGFASAWSNRRALGHAAGFALLASGGALGWLIFSFAKWNDALQLPHRTMWLNLHFQPAHHSAWFRSFTVPASILISLSPFLVTLAVLGVWQVVLRGSQKARALTLLALILFTFNYYSSARYEVTQARYTLLYSWLFLPFSFQGLHWMSSGRWRWAADYRNHLVLVLLFLVWQAGIIVGGRYAPPPFGDQLGALSPTIPLHHEMRELTNLLKAKAPQQSALILDDYNWESPTVFRFANLQISKTFAIVQRDYDSPAELRERLDRFVRQMHPTLLVCSPAGPIGKLWSVDHRDVFQLESLGLQLGQVWRGEHWRIYSIVYSGSVFPQHSRIPDSPRSVEVESRLSQELRRPSINTDESVACRLTRNSPLRRFSSTGFLLCAWELESQRS